MTSCVVYPVYAVLVETNQWITPKFVAPIRAKIAVLDIALPIAA
jgi:hypothetical protein